MSEYTIKSRKLGHDVTFSIPGKSYVYVDLTPDQSRPGTLGQQICRGGSTRGSTITSCDVMLEATARNWWRSYIKTVDVDDDGLSSEEYQQLCYMQYLKENNEV